MRLTENNSVQRNDDCGGKADIDCFCIYFGKHLKADEIGYLFWGWTVQFVSTCDHLGVLISGPRNVCLLVF